MDRYRVNLSLDKATLDLLHKAAWDAHMQPTAYAAKLMRQALGNEIKASLFDGVEKASGEQHGR